MVSRRSRQSNPFVSNTLGINTTLVSWCVLSKIYNDSTRVLICFDSRYRSAPAMHGSNVRVGHGMGMAQLQKQVTKTKALHMLQQRIVNRLSCSLMYNCSVLFSIGYWLVPCQVYTGPHIQPPLQTSQHHNKCCRINSKIKSSCSCVNASPVSESSTLCESMHTPKAIPVVGT